jgi:hypothetical protein
MGPSAVPHPNGFAGVNACPQRLQAILCRSINKGEIIDHEKRASKGVPGSCFGG